MRFLIEAHHPAHIHFFKYAIRIWQERGDEVLLIGRDRDVMKQLLAAYDWIPAEIVSSTGRSNRFPLREMLLRQLAVAERVRRFRPSLVLSLMGSYTQVARLLGVPNIIFTDSEFQSFNHRIAHPFATLIYTPRCFWKPLGSKQRRYAGYHELAFLHPKRFTARPAVLERLRVNGGPAATGAVASATAGAANPQVGAEGSALSHPQPGEYVVIRTSAWNTLHDIGQSGLGPHFERLMQLLVPRYSVYIVPEGGQLAPRWAAHRLSVPPDEYHDVLAFAKLVITEGASTASEAACLGVPSVYVNTTRRGYLEDQERRYQLVYNFTDPALALAKTAQLLAAPPSVAALAAAQARLIADHIDVTDYVVGELDRFADATL
jgi:predicted glycosyltransferase